MNKKLTYEQPSCDLFVIKVEEGFLQASYGEKGAAGTNLTNGGVYNFDDE